MNQQTTNRDTGEAAATNAPANSATSTSTPDNQPTPLDAFEVLLITGMSGAGRSHAADCVEDMGWYVVDNLPPKLLIPLVDMMTTSGSGSESGVHKLAAVIDVRSSYFDELAAVLGHLDDLGVKTRILFLDASNEVLIKRYESVRRPHPLQHGNRLIAAGESPSKAANSLLTSSRRAKIYLLQSRSSQCFRRFVPSSAVTRSEAIGFL